jgi:hypothetical protein
MMNTGNRVLWTLIGLLLTAAGVFGVLVSLDRIPGTYPQTRVLSPQLLEQWRRWEGWATAGVVVLGVLAAVLGLLLLRVQLRKRGRRHLADLTFGQRSAYRPGARPPQAAEESGPPAGVTQVRYRAVAHSLERDLQAQAGVQRANVMICGRADRPEVLLDLTAPAGADLVALRGTVGAALERFSATTGLTPASVHVNTRVAKGMVGRVA